MDYICIAMTAPSTVDALLPLSLLEAVRSVDSPRDELETEYVPELRNKRLGLSDTVYAQIQRYAAAVRRSQRAPHEEAVALARLIGRRADAEEVFASAGRILAQQSLETTSPITRRVIVVLPSILARPLAFREARRIAARYLNGAIRRVGSSLMLEVTDSVTVDSAPHETGCAYYESVLRELVRTLVGGSGAVEHVRCLSRGEGVCEWRAEWRRN
jgi:predicted hydrocarbon binding protein